MPYEIYSPAVYPKYCAGYVSLMDETAARTVIEMIFKYDLEWIRKFPLDDVLITGIIVGDNGMVIICKI